MAWTAAPVCHQSGGYILSIGRGQERATCCIQVDGIENPKVQSVFFPDTPLHKAAFANDGAQVSGLFPGQKLYLCCKGCDILLV